MNSPDFSGLLRHGLGTTPAEPTPTKRPGKGSSGPHKARKPRACASTPAVTPAGPVTPPVELEPYQGAYVSDDEDFRLRSVHGLPGCRGCRHYSIRHSRVLGTVLMSCGAVPGQTPEGQVMAKLLMKLAQKGQCPEVDNMPAGTYEDPEMDPLALATFTLRHPG